MAVYFENLGPFADPLEELKEGVGPYDHVYHPHFHGLMDGTQSPAAVAAEFDAWVSSETTRLFDQLRNRNPPFTLSPDEEAQGESLRNIGPNSSWLVGMIVGTIATICTAYSPQHYTQDRLVQLLKELKALSHEVPTIVDADSDNTEVEQLVFNQTERLWRFGDDLSYVSYQFAYKADELGHDYSDVETPGSEIQIRWRNFQAFLARISAADLVDCSEMCSLITILPSSIHYPDLEARKIGGPRRIEGDLIAGSYWLSGDEGRWLYERCRKRGEADDVWSLKRWNELKGQLEFIQGDGRFTEKCRQLAEDLRKKMIAQEEQK